MPLYTKDDATALLVARLAKLHGISKQGAVKLAVRAELNRVEEALPLRDRFAALRATHPLPHDEPAEGVLRRSVQRGVTNFADADVYAPGNNFRSAMDGIRSR